MHKSLSSWALMSIGREILNSLTNRQLQSEKQYGGKSQCAVRAHSAGSGGTKLSLGQQGGLS